MKICLKLNFHWPQTVTELLDLLDAKIKTNIHFNKYIFGTYKHAIRKKCFKFLPLSLEILLNLCLHSIKQETACQFNININ